MPEQSASAKVCPVQQWGEQMRIAALLERVSKRGQKNSNNSQSRGDEQRDRSSMADFVRILQNLDRKHSEPVGSGELGVRLGPVAVPPSGAIPILIFGL